MMNSLMQSSQVDLSSRGNFFSCIAFDCDAGGITSLRGIGAYSLREKIKLLRHAVLYSEQEFPSL